MYFKVTSTNRLAVRKLLTAAGADSAMVRTQSLAALGVMLHQHVNDGKITEADAAAACQSVAQPTESEHVSEPRVAPATNSNDQDALAMLRKLLGAIVDKTQVQAIVAEAFAEIRKDLEDKVSGVRPAVIEIRADGVPVSTVNGTSTHAAFDDVVKVISTRVQGRRLHVWLVGPSGSGKSYLASQAALALGLNYYSTSAIQSKYDLIGFVPPAYTGDLDKCPSLLTAFRRAFQFGGAFAWDDIDASDPRAFVAFNEALANGRFAFPDGMVEQHADFVCIASANTWGTGATADYVGRNKIDSATLSRFVRLMVDYDEVLERALVGNEHADWAHFVQRVRDAVRKEGIKVLVTPRHTLQGAALIAAGMPRDKVESATVFAGLDNETVSRLRRAA